MHFIYYPRTPRLFWPPCSLRKIFRPVSISFRKTPLAAGHKRPKRDFRRVSISSQPSYRRSQRTRLASAPGVGTWQRPGFLAEYILSRCSSIERYTLLDFSPTMLDMSRERLEGWSGLVFFDRSISKRMDGQATSAESM